MCARGAGTLAPPHYRRSSIIREEKVAALKDLPQLKDTPITKREVGSGVPGVPWPRWLVWHGSIIFDHFTSDIAATVQAKVGAVLCHVQFRFGVVRQTVCQQPPLLVCVLRNSMGYIMNRGKELKRVTLLELVDYVNSAGGQKVFVRACQSRFARHNMRFGVPDFH